MVQFTFLRLLTMHVEQESNLHVIWIIKE